jgi:large subunit ribosomal protein L25
MRSFDIRRGEFPMSDDIPITTEPRTRVGTSECRRLRRSGRIPANIIGHGEEPEAVSVTEDAFRPVLTTGHKVVDLTINGKTQKALVRDVQWDTFSQYVQHIDFLRVDATERMVVDVPIVLRGTPPGVTAGGVLDHHMHTVSVEAPAVQIPDQLEVRVLDLQIGDAIHVRDVKLPPDVKMMDDPDQIVVQVNEPIEIPEEEAGAELEAAGAEPELVSRKEDEGEESGDEE